VASSFTGGFAPGLWRPLVSIQAFDLTESEIDITPFLPYVTDGKPHSFTIKVKQLANSGNGSATLIDVGSYWLATGKIFLFYGPDIPKEPYANKPPQIVGVDPNIQVSSYVHTAANGTNLTLSYTVTASRELSISSELGSFSQNLYYSNTGFVEGGGLTQTNVQVTKGSQNAVDVLAPSFNQDLQFSYPISVYNKYISFNDGNGLNISAAVNSSLTWTDSGRPDISTFSLVAGPSTMDNAQDAVGFYSSLGLTGGTTEQTLTETSYGSTYSRHVIAGNQTVVLDSNPDVVVATKPLVRFGPSAMRGPKGMRRGHQALMKQGDKA
jgi:hypothetical protein